MERVGGEDRATSVNALPPGAWIPGDMTPLQEARPGGSSTALPRTPPPAQPQGCGYLPAPWPGLGLVTNLELPGMHSADPGALLQVHSCCSSEATGLSGGCDGWASHLGGGSMSSKKPEKPPRAS